ncbi:response regulator transcription factor [Massilia sp. SR12]
MRILLGETQYRVVGEAGTLMSAQQKLSSTPTDIVILDLEMPDGNGINLVPRLMEINPNMVIVVASAHNDASSVQTALQMGAHGYMIKPFTPNALESTLARALRRAGCSVPMKRSEY